MSDLVGEEQGTKEVREDNENAPAGGVGAELGVREAPLPVL